MNVELNLGVAAVLLGTILVVRLFAVSGCSSRSSATIVSEFQTCWQLYRKTESSDLKPQTNEQTKIVPKGRQDQDEFQAEGQAEERFFYGFLGAILVL